MAQEFYKKFPILMTAPQFASTPLHRLFFHELWQLYDTLPSIEHDKLNQLLESFAKVLEGINFSQTEKTAYLLFMLLMPLGRSATNPSNITVYIPLTNEPAIFAALN